jgi:hypothetical protein
MTRLMGVFAGSGQAVKGYFMLRHEDIGGAAGSDPSRAAFVRSLLPSNSGCAWLLPTGRRHGKP